MIVFVVMRIERKLWFGNVSIMCWVVSDFFICLKRRMFF